VSNRVVAPLALMVLCGAALGAAAFCGLSCVADPAALQEQAAEAERGGRLDHALGRSRRFYERKRQTADDLFAGRYGFTEAVDRLAASEAGPWRQRLDDLRRTYAVDADRDCLATSLLAYFATEAQEDPARRRQWSASWPAEYRANFRPSTPPPWEWDAFRSGPPLAGLSDAPAPARRE
jgi:hypothetical protein